MPTLTVTLPRASYRIRLWVLFQFYVFYSIIGVLLTLNTYSEALLGTDFDKSKKLEICIMISNLDIHIFDVMYSVIYVNHVKILYVLVTHKTHKIILLKRCKFK